MFVPSTGLSIKIFEFIKKKLLQRKLEKARLRRKDYTSIIGGREFLDWKTELLENIYSNESLIHFQSVRYPIVLIPSTPEFNHPFLNLENHDKSDFSITDSSNSSRYSDEFQKEYLDLLEGTILRPNDKGFAFKKIFLTDRNEIESVSVSMCTFIEHVLSSSILEYELLKVFRDDILRAKTKTISDPTVLLSHLPIRKEIHSNFKNAREILFSGKGRTSLISCQLFIIFKDHLSDKYKSLIFKRSDLVSYAPGTWQLVPNGYFEIFESSVNTINISKNFNAKLCLYRELLEELFDRTEFIANVEGDPVENILKDPIITDIERAIASDTASFTFLGSAFDLVTLGQNLSFSLLIDDDEFSRNSFYPNFEASNLELIEIDDLHKIHSDGVFMPETVGLIKLALSNKDISEKIKNQPA